MKITKIALVFLIFIFSKIIALFFLDGSSSTILDEILVLCLLGFSLLSVITYWYKVRFPVIFFLLYCLTGISSIFIYKVGGVIQPLAGIVDIILDSKLIFLTFAFYYLFRKMKQPELALIQISKIVFFLSLVNLLFVFRDSLSGGIGIWGQQLVGRLGFWQPAGIFYSHVESSWITLLGLYFSVYLYFKRKSKIYFIAGIFLFTGLMMHFSVKEILVCLMSTTLFFSLRNKDGRAVLIFPFSIIILIPLFLFTSVGDAIISQLTIYTDSANTDYARVALTRTSFSLALDYFPFGSGSGTFASSTSYQMGYSNIYKVYGLDNIYGLSENYPNFITDVFWPKIIGQNGFIGLIFYILFLMSLYFNIAKKYLMERSLDVALCFYVFTSAIVISLASTPFNYESFMVILSLCIAYGKMKYDRN